MYNYYRIDILLTYEQIDESVNVHGMAHLFEHIIMNRINSKSYLSRATSSGNTTKDSIKISFYEVDSSLKWIIQFFKDFFGKNIIDKDVFEYEKDRVIFEIENIKYSTIVKRIFDFESQYFESHYNQNVFGSVDDLENLSYDEFIEFCAEILKRDILIIISNKEKYLFFHREGIILDKLTKIDVKEVDDFIDVEIVKEIEKSNYITPLVFINTKQNFECLSIEDFIEAMYIDRWLNNIFDKYSVKSKFVIRKFACFSIALISGEHVKEIKEEIKKFSFDIDSLWDYVVYEFWRSKDSQNIDFFIRFYECTKLYTLNFDDVINKVIEIISCFKNKKRSNQLELSSLFISKSSIMLMFND